MAEEQKTSWLDQVLDSIGSAVSKIIPENVQLDERVVKAFKDLSETVIPKLSDTSLHPELEWDATVRTSNDLSEEEVKFVRDRKNYIREAFAKYVGVDVSEVHVDDIPEIAFMGSGGGFRAMIAVTAYLSALQDSGLYDCGVYLTGLSGSCWNLAQLYTSIGQSQENPIQALLEFYRTKLDFSLASGHGVLKTLAHNDSPQSAVELTFGGLIQKKHTGIKISLMDMYGALLAVRLMLGPDPSTQHKDFKLSEQKKYIEGGKNLMPIYVATEQVRPWKDSLDPEHAAKIPNYEQVLEEHKKKADHYRWYEFNPYEVGSDELAAWIPSWAFGRKFDSKKNVERYPEQNLGLLIGLMGAAPSAPLISDITQFLLLLPEGKFKTEFKKSYDEAVEKIGPYKKQKFEGAHPVSQPKNHNFIYHLNPPPFELGSTSNETFDLADSGVSNDFPMYPITHPNRKIDIVIGFDCSSVIIDHKIFDAEQDFFCNRRGIKRVTRDVSNKYCEIYDYIPTGKTDDEYLPPAKKQFVLCYMQYLPNDKVDPSFVPSTAKFAAFNNFVYSTAQIDLMVKLAKQNWEDGKDKVREIVIETWKKKKEARLNGTVFP